MKRGKAPGEGGTVVDLQVDAEVVQNQLDHLFTQITKKRKNPIKWCNASVILPHKQVESQVFNNIRSINLLSHNYV